MGKKFLCGVIIVCLALGANTALADGLPELQSQWWQFVLSIPSSVNPLLDTTGANCMVGQRGPTWFLLGSLGGAVTRSCSIPQGESLFFPVVNIVNVNIAAGCVQGNDTIADLREQIAGIINSETNVSAEIDDRPIKNILRVKSSVFPVALPADSLLGCSGVFSPAVADGYYVLFQQPLSVGNHTLHFMATGDINQDITYNLSIVPVTLK